jgi:hypothetical protein
MALNKCNYDFHLLAEGWLSVPPYEEGSDSPIAPEASHTPIAQAISHSPYSNLRPNALDESVATIRMIEFSSDDKPDIWYKAEVVNVSEKHDEVTRLIEKYGLPNAIRVNCIAQQVELRERLLGQSK